MTGIILAGGKSSRMGTDKGLLMLNGKPMIQHVIDRIEELGLPILIVANNSEYAQFGYPVIEDLVKEKGPVGGIYTGLMTSNTESNLIISCDTPNISLELLNQLIDASKDHVVTIAKHKGQLHPLIGVYKRSALDAFNRNLTVNQLKLSPICTELNAHILTIEDNQKISFQEHFSNINTPNELKQQSI